MSLKEEVELLQRIQLALERSHRFFCPEKGRARGGVSITRSSQCRLRGGEICVSQCVAPARIGKCGIGIEELATNRRLGVSAQR